MRSHLLSCHPRPRRTGSSFRPLGARCGLTPLGAGSPCHSGWPVAAVSALPIPLTPVEAARCTPSCRGCAAMPLLGTGRPGRAAKLPWIGCRYAWRQRWNRESAGRMVPDSPEWGCLPVRPVKGAPAGRFCGRANGPRRPMDALSSWIAEVDLEGFEPSTSSVRLKRAPNCATGPRRSIVLEPPEGVKPRVRAPRPGRPSDAIAEHHGEGRML
jgi:hypothetical protein